MREKKKKKKTPSSNQERPAAELSVSGKRPRSPRLSELYKFAGLGTFGDNCDVEELADGVVEATDTIERPFGRAERAIHNNCADTIERQFIRAERAIHDNCGSRFSQWAEGIKSDLYALTNSDKNAMDKFASVTESQMQMFAMGSEKRTMALKESSQSSLDRMRDVEAKLAEDIKKLGESAASFCDEVVEAGNMRISRNADACIDTDIWAFDAKLRAVWLKASKEQMSVGHFETMSDLFDRKVIQKQLYEEKDGWEDSQQADLEILRSELWDAHEKEFQQIVAKFSNLSTGKIASKTKSSEVHDLINGCKKRMEFIERETHYDWGPKLKQALAKAQNEYHDLDRELQDQTFKALQGKFEEASHMHVLKLVLCRWRLDYQQIFHSTADRLSGSSHIGTAPPPQPKHRTKQQHLDARLAFFREMLLEIWERNNTPNHNIKQFLDQVIESAAKAGKADVFISVYDETLKQVDSPQKPTRIQP